MSERDALPSRLVCVGANTDKTVREKYPFYKLNDIVHESFYTLEIEYNFYK